MRQRLRALNELARAAARGDEAGDILGLICSSVVESFGFSRAGLWRYRPESGEVCFAYGHGLDPAALGGLPSTLAERPLLRRALEAGEAVYFADARPDSGVSPALAEQLEVGSVVAVPLVADGRCLGFLSADRCGEVFVLDPASLDVLTTVGVLAATFLERAEKQAELARLNELRSRFVALASHELRTPVSVVTGIGETLHARGDDLTPDTRRELRRLLVEQGRRLTRLVDQLLDLSRLEANAVAIEPRPLLVRARLEEVVAMVAGSEAEITVEAPGDLEVVIDSEAFDRVAANLITNALRYGAPPVVVRAEQSDRHFRLTVEDRGAGVDPSFVPRLFERFSRSRSDGERVPGSGLGLSIAQSYAEAHGGRIVYEPAKPTGARFQLVVPNPAAARMIA